jgi:Carboxypeptidase regulatory-like domain
MQRSLPNTIYAVTPILIITILCSAAVTVAWQNMWIIRGHVSAAGRRIANVPVEATNVDTGDTHRTTTNNRGFYIFRRMPKGRYKIRVSVDGYRLNEIGDVRIGPDLPDRFDIGFTDPDNPPRLLSSGSTIQPTITPPPSPNIKPAPTANPQPGESPSPSPAQFGAVIDNILKNLAKAKIAFNEPPRRMELDETRSIDVVLSPTKTAEETAGAVKELGRIVTAEVKISDFMDANLVGSGFDIKAITPTKQFVSKTEDTFWKWDIKAVRPGRQRLNLTMNVIIEAKGKEIQKPLPTFSHDIEVDVSFSNRVKGFVEANWQWLWVTLVVPVSAWLWRRRSAYKKQADQSDQSGRSAK